jgi:hypothetical protein
MAVFPDTPQYSYPVVLAPVWNTLKSQFDNGNEQRRQKWLSPKFDVQIAFKALELADAKTIYEFYMARKGSFEAFYFFDPYVFDHVGLFVVTADGSTTIFDIPGKSTSARTLYENGSEVSSGFSYLSGGGDGEADRISYTVAPTAGTIITIDFTGYLRVKCRFKEDNLNRENFTTALFKYGLELKGV